MITLYLVEPTSGNILNLNGEYRQGDADVGYRHVFDNLDDALAVKTELLKIVTWARVQLYDSDTKEELFFSNESIENQYIDERTELTKYHALPWYKRIFTSKPVSKYVKT